MTAAKFVLILALIPTAGGSAHAQSSDGLNLVCFGVGEKMTSEYKTDLVWDKYDHKYRSRDGITTGMKQMDTAVTVQIDKGDGRIRLPKALVPPIASGGDDQHWWQLNNIQMSANQISASYKLNGLNHPKLKIDRTTGEITIKGFGQDFHGRCDRLDPGQRRF
ncbi:hypothetical protein [Sphingobium boeckii]|uniref:Uncharacterized protein n=1 Tax=Sphingobium boeckii TaxID=1082345 RepID=A0A7W9EDY0_9SPHN|nr:hypothetical protein [Sphingobium boeckii]MBB5685399.1 hypothetical protein [Sphingobium boeckii]